MGDSRPSLENAYLAAEYWVESKEERLCLRVGQQSEGLDRLLAAHGVEVWAYVTGCNPESVQLPSDENRDRQNALRGEVAVAGYAAYEGEGIGVGWPGEASLLVLGIGESEAAGLAWRFGQRAVLVGRRGERVRLLWLDDPA